MDMFNLFDQFPDMLFILDMKGNMLKVNDTVTRRLGYAAEELVGNSVLMLHPAERREEAAEIVQRLIRNGEGHCPIPVICKDKKLIPVETRVVPGQWNDQDVLFGICKDISDVKFSEEKFSKTFHATAAAMALSTYNEGRFIDVNDAFLSVLGYSREEVIGKTSAELNIFSAPLGRSKALSDLISQGLLKNFEATIQDKKGDLHHGLFSAETIYIQDSLCLLTTMIDITERKKIEESLRKTAANAKQLADENAIIARIGQIVGSSMNMDEIYEHFAKEALKLIPFDGIAINVIRDASLSVPYVSGRTGIGCEVGEILPLEGSVTGLCAADRSSRIVNLQDRQRVQAEYPTLVTAFDGGLRSLIVAPFVFKDQLIGAIHLRSVKPDAYSEDDRLRAERICSQIAGAVMNTQLYAEQKNVEAKLRESEEHFRSIFENSLDGIMLTKPSGEILSANRAALQILGRTMEELRSGGRQEIVVRDEALATGLEERERAGRWRGELTYLDNDGKAFPVEVSSSIFHTQDGQAKTCIIFRDITDRRQAEHSLQESQKKYHQLFDLESDALFLVDRETYEFLDVNRAAVELYGYTREDFLSMKNFAISAEPEKTQSAVSEGIGDVPIRWHRRKDGTIFPVEITGAYFVLDGQNVHLAAVRDNTERLRIEQALQDSEQRWKFALEGAGDGVWDWDASKSDILFSKQWKTMLGYSEPEIGSTLDEWDRLVHPEDKKVVYREFRRHLRGETEVYQSEYRILCKDGTYKWILDRGKVIEWTKDGKPCRIIGTHTDISERKRAEEELTSHRDRLEELVKQRTEELEGKTEGLQEVNAALKVLLKQRDDDRKEMEERYVSNIKNLILPYLEKFANTRLDERQNSYLEIMQGHFNEIMSPLLKSLQQFNLTPMETQVASLIKSGKSTKEIAQIMKVSAATVDNHRKSIRKKLGLNKVKANLQLKLSSITE